MHSIDSQVIDIMEVRLDSTYIRFEATYWYKYDRNLDAYFRVLNSTILEQEFQNTKEEKQ